MAATPSNMLPLGTKAPYFELFDPIRNEKSNLNELRSDKATVIAFICNHCPFVIHINSKFVEIANKYIQKGVSFIAINSNDVVKYPQDSPEKMKELAMSEGFNFSYLFDETQDVAKAYQAACTPDIYLFDQNMELVYRGQFDDSRPNNGIPVTGNDLSNAIDCLLEGKQIERNQKASIGCNIKWK